MSVILQQNDFEINEFTRISSPDTCYFTPEERQEDLDNWCRKMRDAFKKDLGENNHMLNLGELGPVRVNLNGTRTIPILIGRELFHLTLPRIRSRILRLCQIVIPEVCLAYVDVVAKVAVRICIGIIEGRDTSIWVRKEGITFSALNRIRRLFTRTWRALLESAGIVLNWDTDIRKFCRECIEKIHFQFLNTRISRIKAYIDNPGSVHCDFYIAL